MSWSPSVCVSARFWSIATLNTSNFTQRSTTAKIFSVVTVETKLGHWSIPIVVEIVTKLSCFYPSLRRQFKIIYNLACPPSLISCRLFPGATINITDEYSASNEKDKNSRTMTNYSINTSLPTNTAHRKMYRNILVLSKRFFKVAEDCCNELN